MPNSSTIPYAPIAAAAATFVGALLLTPMVIAVATRRGLVAKPRADRWHKRPTALFGGIAIFVPVALAGLALLPWTAPNAGILLGALLVFSVGLVDDMLHIKPSTKLIGQIASACVPVLFGVHVGFLEQAFLFVPITIFWIVAITNAFNLIDNMDGLSAGVAAISSLFVVLFAHALGDADTVLPALIGGAAAGFLLFNFHPAKVFMGDCGSMTLGFLLACASVIGTWQQASNLLLILIAPALLLAVPIFDAALVTVLRTLHGRPVSQGGRDHSSHRLVALGLTERQAVLTLYGVCAVFGLTALAGFVSQMFVVAVVAILLVVGTFFFGVFLGQVPVYEPVTDGAGLPAGPSTSRQPALIGTIVFHKRRIAEVAIDFLLICAAYAGAFLLRFDGRIAPADQAIIVRTLPILIVAKMSAFFLFGVYRGVWRYVGIHDALNLTKAVLAGSIATVVALLLAYRFEGMSRSVFVLDGLLLLFFASGTRVLLRVFRELVVGARANARRVLVVGAGDGGEMLLREIRNSPQLGMTVVGLIDDDPEKHGREVHGVAVLGGRADLAEAASRTGAEEILIAIPSASGAVLAELSAACAATGLPYRTTRRATELVDGRVTVAALRELDVLDLVQRHPTRIDDARLRSAVEGRTIAILGCGGTLGRALARRALDFGPRLLLLVDRDDNALVELQEELPAGAPVKLALAVVENGPYIATLLQTHRIETVFHAASLSQGPLLEENPLPAARVNVLGVRQALDAALQAGVGTFVLVSSRRAGDTATVHGVSRRIAERIAAGFSGARMQVHVVRLGKVLGSRGGFLARFREQALRGGPILLSEMAATRYLLASEVAANTLLLAAAPRERRADREVVMVPEGGRQVPLAEIASAVARWANAAGRTERAVAVTAVGLRPGERLRDPEPEGAVSAVEPGLLGFTPLDGGSSSPLAPAVDALDDAVRAGDPTRVRQILCELYPSLASGPKPTDAGNVVPLRR